MHIHIDQQCHGYKNGHQLLAGSIKLVREDQDLVDRLSDISGALAPGETFAPYLTAYPLPSSLSYVLARTWQDLNAPRAGCVLTRSLFIPMAEWGALSSLASLLDTLVPFERDESMTVGENVELRSATLPPVTSTAATDIIEAIFLEDRQPTVVFDETQSELILERLLLAFWPSMRQRFSACSYALSPRTIKGKSLDLVFAPKLARSRFGRWEGRAIDSKGPRSREGRHRWTAGVAKHVFQDSAPSLLGLDSLGILRLDDSGDESNMRLALLWNELSEKAEQSPAAVLGLLDILRARRSVVGANTDVLRPLISSAVESSQYTMTAKERLEFLLALVGKFPYERLPLKQLTKVRNAIASITTIQPQLALDLLKQESSPRAAESPIVTAGFGDGLATAKDIESQPILMLSNEKLLRLAAYSTPFARYLLAPASTHESSSRVTRLIECLSHPETDLYGRARRRIIPLLTAPMHAPILRLCVRDISPARLVRIVNTIWSSTSFSVAEFDSPLCDAAKGEAGMAALRSSILDKPESADANRFLLRTIRLYPEDVTWLTDNECVSAGRKIELLQKVLEDASDENITALARDTSTVHKIDDALHYKISTCSGPLARLLRLSNLPTDYFLDRVATILPFLDNRARKEISETALNRGLASGPSSADSMLRQLVTTAGRELSPRNLATIATPAQATADRISANIIILNESPSNIRRGILLNIEELTDRLIRRHGTSLSAAALEAWSDLLRDSGSINKAGQLRAASNALSFALSNVRARVSPLVVSTFPIVDAELKTEREAPSLLTFFFTDWDRCKTARKDLIRAFLRSNWPPSDLIRAVIPTGDLPVVLRMLQNERDSDRFLSALRNDVQRLPLEQRNRIEPALKAAWDEVQYRQ